MTVVVSVRTSVCVIVVGGLAIGAGLLTAAPIPHDPRSAIKPPTPITADRFGFRRIVSRTLMPSTVRYSSWLWSVLARNRPTGRLSSSAVRCQQLSFDHCPSTKVQVLGAFEPLPSDACVTTDAESPSTVMT